MHLAKSNLTASLIQAVVGYELVTYWGANDNERSLAGYCTSSEGINIIIVSFLSTFGGGRFPSGYIGPCQIDSNGNGSEECQGVANDINTCKNNGKKVFLSIGGANSDFSLTSSGDAKGVAYSLWNSFANPAATSNSPRPLGNTFVNGWDVDIESNPNNQSQKYLGTLVNTLRGYFLQDTSNTYYISGAPQCVIKDTNMGPSMMQAQYDYLWIQFYNNNCAAADAISDSNNNPNGAGSYNLASWPHYLSGGASKNARLYTGIPSSEESADYIPTNDIAEIMGQSEGVKNWQGFMIYDAGDSDIPQDDGCNYAQNVRRVLDTGNRRAGFELGSRA